MLRPRRRPRSSRPAALAAAGLLIAALAAAQEPSVQEPAAQEPAAAAFQEPAAGGSGALSEAGADPAAPARFLIETLTVEGAKETLARIVEAETLLDEGGTYTEADLRQAVARVHRLPFVVDATFALRRGSARGAYELVIQVEPARWFFFDFQSLVNWSDVSVGGLENNGSFDVQAGTIGARAFLGRSGVLFVGTGYTDGQDTATTQVGYTRYDLFGRGVIANLFYSTDYSCCGVVGDDVLFDSDRQRSQFGLNLAVPLSRFHALQLDWTERRDEVDLSGLQDIGPDLDLAGRSVELRWVRDTSDDPLLPRHGTVYSLGLQYTLGESFRFATPGQDLDFFDHETYTVDVTATRHWPLTPRQSVSAGGRLLYQTTRSDSPFALPETDSTGGALSARHLFRLWTLREPGNLGDLYLETGASYAAEERSPERDGALVDDVERLELSTALIYRSQWGRVRLNFSYVGGDVR